jgi:thiol-disulfide isomerase/thioredoxin
MQRWFSLLTIKFLLAGIFWGCSNETNAPLIEPIDEAVFQQLVQQRNGKILLVNVWATWCLPCREEFPDLVKLAETYQGSDIEIIGISADYPDEIESKILPFLQEQKANFKNYVRNFEDDQVFINTINPKWSGALPVTVVYDRQGKQQVFHLGEADFETFRQKIESVR